MNCYVPILGSAINFGNYTSSAVNSGYGPVANDGVLTLWSKVKMPDISDGTSNTGILSEWSDKIRTSTATFEARGNAGFAIGPRAHYYTTFATWVNPPCTDLRPFNTTSIRYSINQTTGWTNNCGTGVCDNVGANTPLNAAHTGGVNMAFADGSVRFLGNTTSLSVLGALAVRNDDTSLDKTP